MGRKAKQIDITEAERIALEKGYKFSKSVSFSRRCHMVLLKSQGRNSEEVAQIFDCTIQVINRWCNRYLKEGIEGLKTKAGQGRKTILNKESDGVKVRAVVEKERQRLKLAKAVLEEELNKEFSLITLKRFLKNLSADGNELD